MAEETEPLRAVKPAAAEISHRRLLITMAIVVVVFAAAGSVISGWRAALGVLFGGGLSFLNYYWIRRSTAALFEAALAGMPAKLVSLRFIGRYLALGLLLLVIYVSDILPAAAVIVGLVSFAFAIVVNGIGSIVTRIIKRDS